MAMLSFSSTFANILAQPFEGGGALARPAWFGRPRSRTSGMGGNASTTADGSELCCGRGEDRERDNDRNSIQRRRCSSQHTDQLTEDYTCAGTHRSLGASYLSR